MTGGTLNLCATSGAGTGNGSIDCNSNCTFQTGGTFNITSSTTTNASNGRGNLTVGGNFIHTTSAASFLRTATLATAAGTVTIDGSVAQTIESTNGFTGTITFNITQSAVVAARTTVPLTKTFTVNSGTTLNVNDNSANSGYDLQVTSSGVLKVSGTMNVNSAAVLDLLGNAITDAATGGGTFNLISDAGLITQHAQGITTLASGATGCIQVTGGRSYSSGADYTYNSSTAAQVTGNGLPASLVGSSNLTINNTYYPTPLTNGGVTLSQATTTAGTLTLTSERLITTAANLMTIDAAGTATSGSMVSQSNFSFVDGPIKKVGSSAAFVFPTGDIYLATGSVRTAKWARIEIPLTTFTSADAFTAEYHKLDDPCATNQAVSNTNAAGINNVSYKEYWDLTRVTGTLLPSVKLYWEDNSQSTSLGSAISSAIPADLIVAEFDGGMWNNKGATGITTAGITGTITSNVATTFTTGTIMPFTFGSPTGVNPLPVELLSFNGYPYGSSNMLEWKTATETNCNHFELERSGDGIRFTPIASVDGYGTTTELQNYGQRDHEPFPGKNYYRLN